MGALLDETKTKKLELGLPWLRELRAGPGLHTLLIEEKPDNMTWQEFAVAGMLVFALITAMVRFDLRHVIRIAVRLTGWMPDLLPATPTPVGSPDGRRNGCR